MPAGCAVVVFEGGVPTGDFGGVQVFTATNGSLQLNNGRDTVTLTSNAVQVVDEYTFGSEGGKDQSITRDPDITGGFVKHSEATGSAGALFSPGTKIDGSAFSGCSSPLLKESSRHGTIKNNNPPGHKPRGVWF